MRFAIILIAFIIAGCASPGPRWQVTESQDRFTDKVTTMVTIGDFSTSSGLYTSPLRYYPFVGLYEGEMYVGLRSGGRVRVPTGTVQLRIDDLEAWTITPAETPLFLMPQTATGQASNGGDAQSAELATAAMAMATRMGSPFTAATGDKARRILAQMLNGHRLIYRVVGLNQAASTTGEVVLDDSLATAVRQIGIDVDALKK